MFWILLANVFIALLGSLLKRQTESVPTFSTAQKNHPDSKELVWSGRQSMMKICKVFRETSILSFLAHQAALAPKWPAYRKIVAHFLRGPWWFHSWAFITEPASWLYTLLSELGWDRSPSLRHSAFKSDHFTLECADSHGSGWAQMKLPPSPRFPVSPPPSNHYNLQFQYWRQDVLIRLNSIKPLTASLESVMKLWMIGREFQQLWEAVAIINSNIFLWGWLFSPF